MRSRKREHDPLNLTPWETIQCVLWVIGSGVAFALVVWLGTELFLSLV